MKTFQLRSQEHLHHPDKKRSFNRELFAVVAPRYDFITRALSFDRDRAWKEYMTAVLPDLDSPVCLDLACGTGDLTELIMRRYPKGRIVGMDLTAGMLQIARKRLNEPHLLWSQQDMASLAIASGSMDIVTGGYALRNAPDLNQTLAEIRRVMKPGAVAAFLDFSRPDSRALWNLEYFLLKAWGGFWGVLLHRNPELYVYIAESLKHFPVRRGLHALLQQHGFSLLHTRLFFFGVMELIVVRRER